MLALVALSSACGANTRASSPLAGIGKEEGAPVRSSAKRAIRSASAATPATPAAKSAARGTTHAKAAEASPKPFTMPYPTDPSVVVDAVLTPVCAHNGTLMTLTVRTNTEAAVGYQAVYSDNGGGGPPPYGRGYGGNGKGLADTDGHFTSNWTITSAPSGVARLDIVVGWRGKFGYRALTFHVGPDSACA